MALKKEYRVFVDEMIKHGDETRAYLAAYPKAKEHAIRKGCLRLSKNVAVQSAIKTEVDKIKAIATQQAVYELKEEIKGNILTRQKKLEILNQIATGQLEIPVKKPVWDKAQNKYVFVPMMEVPDHNARIKAMEVDSKMTGDYAPAKWEGELKNPILVEHKEGELNYSKMPLALRKQLLAHLRSNDNK